MCLCGVIVAAILLIGLMRKSPDETAANDYVDDGRDTTGKAAASFGGLSKASDGGPNCLGATALTLFLADLRRSWSPVLLSSR